MEPTRKLSRRAIDRFKEIHREESGEILSDDEAEEMALRLLRIFDILSDDCQDPDTDAPIDPQVRG
jgi:hypothetical protein